MPSLKVSQELLDQLVALAAEEMRTPEQQAAWLIQQGLKRQADKGNAKDRQARRRAKAKGEAVEVSRDSHVTVT